MEIRFGVSETPRVGLNFSKWLRKILMTILQTHLDIMFGTTKSWFLVRRSGLSSQSPAEALSCQIEHLFKAHYATKTRFTASETTKVGLNHPKWPRNTLVTILQTCLDIIFGAEKSWFLVCCGGLSNKSPCTSHVTLTDQSSEAPNCLKNHFWDSKTIKNVFNGPKMT